MDCRQLGTVVVEMQGKMVGRRADYGGDDDDEKVVDACVGDEVGVSRPRIRQLNPEFIMTDQCQPSERRQR